MTLGPRPTVQPCTAVMGEAGTMHNTRSHQWEIIVITDGDSDIEYGYPDPVITRAASPTNEHWIEVTDAGAEWCPEDRWEWELLHPSRCLGTYCAEASLLDEVGPLDALGVHPTMAPDGTPHRDGRWRVEFTHDIVHCGDFATEHDVYLMWLDDPFTTTADGAA